MPYKIYPVLLVILLFNSCIHKTDRRIIHKNLGKLMLANQVILYGVEMKNLIYHKDIGDFIEYLDKEKKFFNDVGEINKYNIE